MAHSAQRGARKREGRCPAPRLHQLKTGPPSHWPVHQKAAYRQVLAPLQDADEGAPLRKPSPVEASAEDPVRRGRKRGRGRFKIGDLFAAERCG